MQISTMTRASVRTTNDTRIRQFCRESTGQRTVVGKARRVHRGRAKQTKRLQDAARQASSLCGGCWTTTTATKTVDIYAKMVAEKEWNDKKIIETHCEVLRNKKLLGGGRAATVVLRWLAGLRLGHSLRYAGGLEHIRWENIRPLPRARTAFNKRPA